VLGLAISLEPDSSIEFPDKVTRTQVELFLLAIELDTGKHPEPFVELASIITTPVVVNNKPMTREELLFFVIKQYPRNGKAYIELGKITTKDKSIVLNGETFSRQQLFERANKL